MNENSKLGLAYILSFGGISIANINLWLSIIVLILTGLWTITRLIDWVRKERKRKKEKREEEKKEKNEE